MDQSQKQSSSESETSLDSGTQGSLDQTTDSLEGISDLNKRLQSSLFISKKPESKSTDAQANEQCNIFQSSDFKESGPEILYRQSSLKETQSSSYESSSRSVQTPESKKTVDDKPSSAIKETVNPKQDDIMQRPHPYSRTRPEGKVLPNTQYFSSTDPKLYPPGYHCNVNPAFLPRSVNPVQNQAFAYPGQYPEQSLMDPNIAYRQDINQWQVPPTNIRMAERPVVLLSRSRKTSYYHNPMPPLRTNATPIRCVQGSSYKNPMPPIKTNSTPIRYVQRSSRYQNPMIPVRMNATSMQHIQLPRPTTSNVSRGMNYSPNVVQSRQDLTPGHFLKLPAKQPQKSTPTAIYNRNISTPNWRQPKKLTKLELAKRVHYSRRNMLPTEDPPANYFPLYATPQRGIALRQVQRTPIQFPTPSGSGYFGSTSAAVRGIIPNLPYQTVGSYARSNVYSYFHPKVTDQAVSRPAIQDNILIQSISNAGNPMQPVIQEQIMTPQTVQYQPAIENLTAAPQYQDPNHLMYQYGTQYQPAMQNLTMEFQHQDPYRAMYQHGTQYQPAMRNLTMEFQYQDPNHAMYQHGTHISSEIFRPPDTPWSYPTYDASIPSQQYNSSILPMQTFATNPSSTSMIQDDPNLVPNISGVQTSVENTSPISVSQYPPGFYATNESTSHIWMDDPNHGSNHYQGYVSMNNPDVMHTNMYTEWAVSTGDPHEDTPIDEREETSKNQ
ncbi:hypothetical protein AVEN_102691-1 [Araneus ventricosus]|uniref:Uncharacterized protein n=1 Tax=Araneus ventricosus TaxID=182803 RepID=A0A4Y2SIR6_ARAVE|nr:hypothetical protein AVEN_102691-1 [Araneus ventricosus]